MWPLVGDTSAGFQKGSQSLANEAVIHSDLPVAVQLGGLVSEWRFCWPMNCDGIMIDVHFETRVMHEKPSCRALRG
jgi:hypothetical protein